MASQPEPASEPRGRLTRDRVLRAAIDLADARGLEALTMRRLAQELGVEAMSLYYYVASKDEILNAIVDIVEGAIELPSPEADWKSALRRTALSAHDVFERHPWAASLTLSATGSRPARWRYMDAIYGCLRRAGFPADRADHAYHALESHIAGFTLWSAQLQVDAEELRELANAFLGSISGDDYPYLVEHVHQHLRERDPGDEGSFAFGLDLLLDGLERIRDRIESGGGRD